MDARFKLKGCGCLVALVLAGITSSAIPHFSRDTYTAKVTEKVVKRKGKSDQYLINTELENGEIRVFTNRDSLFEGKFDSSDIYAEIKQGNTYQFETYGWRVPFLSMYENIVEFDKVESDETEPVKETVIVREVPQKLPDYNTSIIEADINGNEIMDKFYLKKGKVVPVEIDGKIVE